MAGKVAVVTDSATGLPAAWYAGLPLRVVPLHVQVGDRSYLESDVTVTELVSWLEAGPVQTAAVNPDQFYRIFRDLAHAGYDEVVVSTISAKLSATFQAANQARTRLLADLATAKTVGGDAEGIASEFQITVLDSEVTGLAGGLAALAAACAAQNGATASQVQTLLGQVSSHSKSLFAVPSLKYLHQGGRISAPMALVGNVLGVRPVLALTAGEIQVLQRVRGASTAQRVVCDLLAAHATTLVSPLWGIMRFGAQGSAASTLLPAGSAYVEADLSAVLGAHVGPEVTAITVVESHNTDLGKVVPVQTALVR